MVKEITKDTFLLHIPPTAERPGVTMGAYMKGAKQVIRDLTAGVTVSKSKTNYDAYKTMTIDELCAELKTLVYWARALSEDDWMALRSSNNGVFGFIMETLNNEYKEPRQIIE